MRFPQVVRDLLRARDELARRGLAKGVLQNERGCVCAMGAIACAITGSGTGYDGRRGADARRALYAVLDAGISTWNDAWERTADDVLDGFDAAASLALSEAVRP